MPDGSNRGIFTGLETCGSATACLRCAAKVRAERALHIGHVVRTHLDAGGYVLFATFTFSHSDTDSADRVLADLAKAWKTMNKSRRWKRFKKWAGVVHYIRVLEITHSDANGWHPHYHVVILTTRPIGLDEDDPLELVDTREELSDLWFHEVTKLGRDVHPDIGVDLEPIRDEAGIGAYVSKLQLETARGDLKRGRGGSRSVWQIGLDAADGCPRSAALWAEYVVAVKGSRWISTSKGLWKAFGIEERTDEEIAEDTPDEVEVVTLIDHELYRAAAKSDGQVLTELRHLLEAGARSEVLASVLSRRLRAPVVVVADRSGAGDYPILEYEKNVPLAGSLPARVRQGGGS